MTASYPIRTVTPDEFEAFTEVPGQAFLEDWQPEARDIERRVIEFDRTIAAFDGEQMVGTAGAYSFHLTVPGGTAAAAAGVSNVSVLPSHRRRGILTSMMRDVIDDARRRDEAVAILFASESGIYRRFGFGLATWHQRLRVGRGDGQLAIGAVADVAPPRLRFTAPADVRADLVKIYDTMLPGRAGMLARNDQWWDVVLSDIPAHRDGMSPWRCVLAEDDSGPRGYAIYRTQPSWSDGIADGTISVGELMALDPAATAALWADLFSRDLVGEVIARRRPVDDPLLAMLADPRRALPIVGDALWVRLIDLPAALVQRSYACAVDIVLEVLDPLLPDNAGRWRLEAGAAGDGAAARCERSTAPADLLLSVHVLGAAYLGGASLGQLAAAGHVIERTPGGLARLAAAMSADPRPWCSMMF